MSDTPSVLVAHAGARHNYALPAAFADAGMLEAFYTDLCAGTGLGQLANAGALLPLPSAIKRPLSRLASRKPPANVIARTRTDDLHALAYQFTASRGLSPKEAREREVEYSLGAFDRMAKWGLGKATHYFSVYGYGGKLAELANERGIPVLTDVIIAISTRRIAMEEYQAYPEWGPPPADGSYADMEGFIPDAHMLATTDIFVCPSEFVRDDLQDNWGIAPQRTRIVPYALRSDWFDLQPETIPGRVLFVGSAERRKGIHYLAFAAQDLGGKFDFRVAGGVSDEVMRQPEAQALNFLGRVPREEVKAEFATADVFVLPTLAEGSATVVYEAMAAGLPVITTKAAGSLVRHEIDGLIIPERDSAALASAIERITGDRELRASMGRSAREQARLFTWDRYAKSLRDIVSATPSPYHGDRSHISPLESGI